MTRPLPVAICSICERNYRGWGNNAWPIATAAGGPSGRCCDDCNREVVLPARLLLVTVERRRQRAEMAEERDR